MIKAVLLDVGGPILVEEHEYAAWEDFLADLLSRYGVPVSGDDVRGVVREYLLALDSNAWLAALWHYLRPDMKRFLAAKAEFDGFKRRWLAGRSFRLREGIEEAIARLRERGYTLALAANQEARAGEFLRDRGITRGFAWDLVSEEMGISKPQPLFFRMILDAIGVRPAEAVMVGNRLDHDILPAKLLGMRTVRVLVEPFREQVPRLPGHCPDRTVADVREIPEAVASLG